MRNIPFLTDFNGNDFSPNELEMFELNRQLNIQARNDEYREQFIDDEELTRIHEERSYNAFDKLGGMNNDY
jgi:hypothetical protein